MANHLYTGVVPEIDFGRRRVGNRAGLEMLDLETRFGALEERLTEETTARTRETTALRRETTTLRRKTTTLRRETTTLRRETTTLRRETTMLQEETTTLQEENTTLRRETTTLRRENTERRRETTALQDEVTGLLVEARKTRPMKDSFRAIRVGELEKAAGVRTYAAHRNEAIHGGNVRGDLDTIDEGETADPRIPDLLTLWKAGFQRMYGMEYDDVQRMHHSTPDSILKMLDIWCNVTHLEEWKGANEFEPKTIARAQLRNRTDELKDRWIYWFRGTQNGADLNEIVRECDEVIRQYQTDRRL
jgi:hypothetical protein